MDLDFTGVKRVAKAFAENQKANVKMLAQSPEELAKVAKKNMEKKYGNVSLYMDKDKVVNAIEKSAYTTGGNKGYINATNKLVNSLDNKDMKEFRHIAEGLSKNFKEDTSYLDFLNEAEDGMKGYMSLLGELDAGQMNQAYQGAMADGIKNSTMGKVIGDNGARRAAAVGAHLKATPGYFLTDDTAKNQMRMKTIGGAYLGLTTANRLSTGGTLTKNEYGERDIVGVPIL